MKKLTETQQKVFDFLQERAQEGIPPLFVKSEQLSV